MCFECRYNAIFSMDMTTNNIIDNMIKDRSSDIIWLLSSLHINDFNYINVH